MARTRNLRPQFFENEDLADLPPEDRLLFQGLWLHADREGRLEDRPRRLKAKIFPYHEYDVDTALQRLMDSPGRFIVRYSVDGNRYIAVPTFEKYQNPHRDEKASEIPSPDCEQATCTMQAPCKHHASTLVAALTTDHLPRTTDHVPLVMDQENPPIVPQGGTGEVSTTPPRKVSRARKPSATIPPVLDVPTFRVAWADYSQHRREKRAAMTPTAERAALKKLTGWGVARAVAALEYSTAAGYTGIIEPDRKSNARPEKDYTQPCTPL